MATNTALPDPTKHALADFLRAYQAARDVLLREQIEQEGVMESGSASAGDVAHAQANVASLTAAIAKLDEARTLFLVRVFTGVIPPSEELVKKTVKLNKDLAKETVDDNRLGAYLRIVTAYVQATTQIIDGSVPPQT